MNDVELAVFRARMDAKREQNAYFRSGRLAAWAAPVAAAPKPVRAATVKEPRARAVKPRIAAARPARAVSPFRSGVDPAAVVALYATGLTQKACAAQLGVSRSKVHNDLVTARVQLRDDRSRNACIPKVYDAVLVEQVRVLAAAGNTQNEIASQVGFGHHVVSRLMVRNHIPRRPAIGKRPADGAIALKARMDAHGVVSCAVRVWARATGLDVSPVGIPPASVVDAYIAATATTKAA